MSDYTHFICAAQMDISPIWNQSGALSYDEKHRET